MNLVIWVVKVWLSKVCAKINMFLKTSCPCHFTHYILQQLHVSTLSSFASFGSCQGRNAHPPFYVLFEHLVRIWESLVGSNDSVRVMFAPVVIHMLNRDTFLLTTLCNLYPGFSV